MSEQLFGHEKIRANVCLAENELESFPFTIAKDIGSGGANLRSLKVEDRRYATLTQRDRAKPAAVETVRLRVCHNLPPDENGHRSAMTVREYQS
jgi:hypothetical protein